MAEILSVADYVVFALGLALSSAVGIISSLVEHCRQNASAYTGSNNNTNRKRRALSLSSLKMQSPAAVTSTSEYFLGNGHLPFGPAVVSIFASFYSAIAILGVPAEIYTTGSTAIFWTLAFIPASFFISFVFIPIYYRNGFTSIFEYIEKRFNSIALRRITTSLSALSSIAYSAVCCYTPCLAFQQVTGAPEWILIMGMSVSTVFYTALGGLRAVVTVSIVQSSIMFIAVFAVLISGWINVGGLERAWTVAQKSGRTAVSDWRVDPTVSHSFWSIFIGSTVYMIAAVNNQSTLQRTRSLPTLRKAMLSFVLVGPLVAVATIAIWLATLFAYAYFSDVVGCDPLASGVVESPNQIFSHFATTVMHYPGFLGLFFVGLFSASLGSMSASYNAVSSMIWEDWLKSRIEKRLSKRSISILIKVLAACIGMVTGLLAVSCKYIGGTTTRMVISLVSAFSSTILSVFLAAAFLPFVTSASLIVALVLGVPFVLWVILSQIIYKVDHYPWLPFNTTGCPDKNGSYATQAVPTVPAMMNLYWPSKNSSVSVSTKQPALLIDAVPSGMRNLISISYFYFPILCVIVCLSIAVIMSLASRLLAKYYFPHVEWLQSPRQVDPEHLALRPWLHFLPKCFSSNSWFEANDQAQSNDDQLIAASKNSQNNYPKGGEYWMDEEAYAKSLRLSAPYYCYPYQLDFQVHSNKLLSISTISYHKAAISNNYPVSSLGAITELSSGNLPPGGNNYGFYQRHPGLQQYDIFAGRQNNQSSFLSTYPPLYGQYKVITPRRRLQTLV